MTEVRVAAELDSVVVTLVVNLRNWGPSQVSWLHLLVDIW